MSSCPLGESECGVRQQLVNRTRTPKRNWVWDCITRISLEVTLYGVAKRFRPAQVNIRRRPPSARPYPLRLLASNSDGFHSFSVEHGPILEQSEQAFIADDFLNVHAPGRACFLLAGGAETPFFQTLG